MNGVFMLGCHDACNAASRRNYSPLLMAQISKSVIGLRQTYCENLQNKKRSLSQEVGAGGQTRPAWHLVQAVTAAQQCMQAQVLQVHHMPLMPG